MDEFVRLLARKEGTYCIDQGCGNSTSTSSQPWSNQIIKTSNCQILADVAGSLQHSNDAQSSAFRSVGVENPALSVQYLFLSDDFVMERE
jgi:hypothetical protein